MEHYHHVLMAAPDTPRLAWSHTSHPRYVPDKHVEQLQSHGSFQCYRFVEKSSPRLLWVNIRKAAQKSGCWSCSRHHKPEISVCVAFRPRLALTRLVSQKSIRVSLVSSKVEWMQKSLCKFVVLLNFWGLVQSALSCCIYFLKRPYPGLLPTH